MSEGVPITCPVLLHGAKSSIYVDPMSIRGEIPEDKVMLVPLCPPIVHKKKTHHWGLWYSPGALSLIRDKKVGEFQEVILRGETNRNEGTGFHIFPTANKKIAAAELKSKYQKYLQLGRKAWAEKHGSISRAAVLAREQAWASLNLHRLGPAVYTAAISVDFQTGGAAFPQSVRASKRGHKDWRLILAEKLDVIQSERPSSTLTVRAARYEAFSRLCRNNGVAIPTESAFAKALQRINRN